MINLSKNIFTTFSKIILFIIGAFLIISVYVRIEGIGYSNFQGDEVNTVDFLYEMNNGVYNYLISQKRGPVQYIINIINVSLLGYSNEFQIRLVYSIAGILALLTLYFLARKIFNSKVAIIASILMSVNGLFIAFARITQYQSIMYFIIPIGVLVFIDAVKKEDARKYLYSGLIMSFALLTHYDTLSVVPFFIGVVLSKLYNYISINDKVYLNEIRSKKSLEFIKHFSIFLISFLMPALLYYIPFAIGESFGNTTSKYLDNRLFGGGLMPRTGLTLNLITMYIPKWHIYFLFIFGMVSLLSFAKYFYNYKLPFINSQILKNHYIHIYIILVLVLLFGSYFSLFPIKPRASTVIVITSSMAICVMLILNKSIDIFKKSLSFWFLGAYVFYFYLMKDPRTHVYVSFIPLFILSAKGFIKIYDNIKNILLKKLYIYSFLFSLFIITILNYLIYVDRSPEYPWWDKSFMGYDLYRIKRVRYEKIDGVFGFNNYRGWEQVAGLFNKGCLVGDFKSNEKDSITYFYTRRHQVPEQGDYTVTDKISNAIIVEGPHSWNYVSPKAPEGYTQLKVIYSNSIPVTYIYGKDDVYPDKKLLCDENVLNVK